MDFANGKNYNLFICYNGQSGIEDLKEQAELFLMEMNEKQCCLREIHSVENYFVEEFFKPCGRDMLRGKIDLVLRII